MPLQRFDRGTLPATPWKNGGGVTREIWCQPAGAGIHDFDWRVSIAEISRDGPFSRFDGVDRVITLLEGAGVRLLSDDGALDHRLGTPLAPFAFAGEAPVTSTLLGGTCHDFNVMTRRNRCRAEVLVCTGSRALAPAAAGLLMSVRSTWQAGEHALRPGQGLWWADDRIAWPLTCTETDAALLAVHFHWAKP